MGQNNIIPNQTIDEVESWKKILVFLQQENAIQKNMLAEVLKKNDSRNENLLETAEQYQNQFLQQDETLLFMWNDLAKLERLVKKDDFKNDYHERELSHRKKKLRKEIKMLDNNFSEMKNDFNNFLEIFLTPN